MKSTLLALLAAAALGGCGSAPNWKEPEVNQKPIVLEDEVKDATKKPIIDDSPGVPDTGKKAELSGGYGTIELEVAYKFENSIAASGFYGHVKSLEKNREFTDYEKMELAFKIDKDGNINSRNLSKIIRATKIPYVEVAEEDLRKVYSENIAVATEEVGEELKKMIDGKSDAEKAKLATAVRAFYNGKDPLTMKQLRKIQEYK